MHTNTPILHRLGDLEPGDIVQVEIVYDTYRGEIDYQQDGSGVRVRISDSLSVEAPRDRMVHRLIPETPATKFAGEMEAQLRDMVAHFVGGDPCENCHEKAADLLSRIDAPRGRDDEFDREKAEDVRAAQLDAGIVLDDGIDAASEGGAA